MKKNIIYLFGCFSIICLLIASCNKTTEPVTTVEATIDGKAVDQTALSLNSFMAYEFAVQSTEKVGRMELIKM